MELSLDTLDPPIYIVHSLIWADVVIDPLQIERYPSVHTRTSPERENELQKTVWATGMSNKSFYIFWHFDLFKFLQLAIPSKTLIPSSWHEIWAQRCGENLFFNFKKRFQILPPPPTGILSRGCIGCAFPFYFQHLKKDINLVWPGTEKGYFWPHLRRPALAIDFYRVSWILYYWTPQKVSYHLIDPFLQDSLLMIVRSIPITFLTFLFLSFTQETLPWRPTSLFSLEQNPAWCRAPLLPCPTSLKSAVWSSFSLLQIKLSGSQHSVLFSLRMIFWKALS